MATDMMFVFGVTRRRCRWIHNWYIDEFSLYWEQVMGNSLHDKIYLGRTSVLSSKPIQAALFVGACVSIGLVWLAMRAFR